MNRPPQAGAPPQAGRVLVLSPNWLGDAIMALPALSDIKRHYAGAQMAVAARASLADLFRLTPGVDRVLTLKWRGQLLRPGHLGEDVATLRAADADIAVLLPNSFAAAWLTRRAGIGERWGYATDLRRPLLTRVVRRPSASVHQAQYYQHLVRELGIESGPLEPAIAIPPDALSAARALLDARGWDRKRPMVAIAPGAAYGTAKRWLPRHYATLIENVVTKSGAQCVLLGSAGDAETTAWIAQLLPAAVRSHVIDLAGATTLPTLAGVIANARVFVSNDSGAMHLASAIGVPVVALFGPTREYETKPLPRAGVRTEVLIHPVWCRPCMLRECPIDHRCMKGLLPERVFASVNEMMAR